MAATEKVTLAQVNTWLTGLAGRSFDFTIGLSRCLIAIISATKENFRGAHGPDGSAWPALKHARPGSKGNDKPLRNNGLLMASLAAKGAAGNVYEHTATRLEWGSNLQQAALQNFGGKVLPKASKYLAIPLTREAVRAGSPRNFGRPLKYAWAMGAKLRGKLVEEKPGRKGLRKTITQYLLVTDVTIPPRPFLGWAPDIEEECGEIMLEAAAEALARDPVNGGGGPLAV